MTPALLDQHVDGIHRVRRTCAHLNKSARSRWWTSTSPAISAAAGSAFGIVRQAITTLWPAAASAAAVGFADAAVAPGDDDAHRGPRSSGADRQLWIECGSPSPGRR